MSTEATPGRRFERALASLRGLSVGDALGSRFFVPSNLPLLMRRELPAGPWQWTDDTEMAVSVLAVLAAEGRVDEDVLAHSFALHHDVDRGYGPAVNRMLRLVRNGGDWRELSAALFGGQGSWGNGAAMRIAPLGAWYAGEAERAAAQAEISARITHRHPEAVAGAMAVAAAAALVADPGGPPTPEGLLDGVLALVPAGAVEAGLRQARDMLDRTDSRAVAAVLGNGADTSAQDTVPFALWSAARSSADFVSGFWDTAQAGGDVDTTCAVFGGVVAGARAGAPPASWLELTEDLPEWLPSGAAH
jgi:ADP-ribosylglycohydrolase